MIGELVVGASTIAAVGFAYARGRRVRLYRYLEERLAPIANTPLPALDEIERRDMPGFSDRLAFVPNFLPARTFAALKAEADRLVAPERSFVPAHKKGGTVAYETLIASAPAIIAFYHSTALMNFIARVAGVHVQPTPIFDQSSLSILCYDKPGDHIGWHYDHNFYRGRHFTVLLAIANVGRAADGLSHAELMARIAGQEIVVSTAPNAVIVFEGAQVHHKVTPILAGERRVVLSMTYCTDTRSRWWQGVSRRLKDTAFYGVRALWT